MGNGEGETSRKFTSPYLGLLNAASNPASGQDVSVSYDMEYDNKSGHRMGIVMKGEPVRRLNAEMGNEGDTYTIKPEEVTNLMMGNNDPENFGLFYQNPDPTKPGNYKALVGSSKIVFTGWELKYRPSPLRAQSSLSLWSLRMYIWSSGFIRGRGRYFGPRRRRIADPARLQLEVSCRTIHKYVRRAKVHQM